MTKPTDTLTAILHKGADILFVQNPKGTSLGVFGGVAADGVLRFFHPWFIRWKDLIDPDRINALHWVAIGIVCLNIPTLFRRRRLPDEIENAIESIRLARREGKISAVQEKMAWLALCNSVVEKVNLAPRKAKAAHVGPARKS